MPWLTSGGGQDSSRYGVALVSLFSFLYITSHCRADEVTFPDISKGVDALPLVKIPGDPYMYVDFTGATLYTRESEQTFKITDLADYAKRAPKDARPDKILEAHFEWKNASATPPEWVGMRLEARCYADSSNKGAYEEIKTVANAGVKNLLNLPSCKNQFIEAIDIKITQIKGESLGDVESLKIHVKQ